jgi:HlyD family secretion protein
MKRKWWIALIAVVVVIVIVAVTGAVRSRQAAALEGLQTVRAATGELTALVGATGIVRANQTAVLTFQTTGIVEAVAVEQGERVLEDETLATLELASLPAQVVLAQADLVAAQRALDDLLRSDLARTQAQLALAQAQDALDLAEYRWRNQQQGYRANGDTIDGARADLVLAESEVDRAQDTYGPVSGAGEDDPTRALALSQLVSARQRRDAAARRLNWFLGRPNAIDQAILDANVALAEAQVADAERAWERVRDGPPSEDIRAGEARVAAAQASVNLAHIAAPFAGTITSAAIMPGDQVAPGTVAFGLADLSRLFVDVDVSEVDINRVQPGQPVTLTIDASPGQTYLGTVVDVALVGTSVQGVVNFPVTVELTDADRQVLPGMTAAVNIVVEQMQDVLLVPNRAVRVRDGERVVYVLRGGRLEPAVVVLGASSDLYSQVVDGELQVGDEIVLNPPTIFEAGGPSSFMGR